MNDLLMYLLVTGGFSLVKFVLVIILVKGFKKGGLKDLNQFKNMFNGGGGEKVDEQNR